MNKDINLSQEEKIDFLVKLETDKNCQFLTKESNESKKMFLGYQLVSTPMIFAAYFIAALCYPPTFGFFPQLVCAKILVDFLLCTPLTIYHKKRDKEILNYITNGKINRKQYINLLKLGEIKNWKHLYENEVQERVNKIKGIECTEYNSEKNEMVKFKPNGYPSYINIKNIIMDVNEDKQK